MQKQPLIIIGAGVAGLVLARELATNFKVTVLEAQPQAGGRIATIQPGGFSLPIETGAEFIHGKLKYTLRLLKEAGIKYVPAEGKMYRKKNGRLQEQEHMVEGWDELLQKMAQLDADLTLETFLQTYFKDEKYAGLRRHAIAFTEGFDVADVKKVSTKSLFREWSKTEEVNFRIPRGYGQLVQFLLKECLNKGCSIFYDEQVTNVNWQIGRVTLATSSGKKWTATKVVLAVPLGVLQQAAGKNAITFSPVLHAQQQAIAQIGFGAVVKIILQFKEAFWPADANFIFSDEVVPTWWTQLPEKTQLLTGWLGGTQASLSSDQGDAEILHDALQSLCNIFDISIEQLQNNLSAHWIANWKKNAAVLGAYSYSMPLTPGARKLLNEPVAGTVYFCGEGIYEGDSPGTVEAAIAHAVQTAGKIKG